MKKFYLVLILSLFVFASVVSAQKNRLISDVQGDKNVSPYVGETARLTGIVTARTRTGFFLQTPDDKTDDNPNTSEGIFVYTRTEPTGEAAIGNLVSVTGTIEEFRPKADPQTLPITELSMRKGTDFVTVESKGNPLPKPIVLTLNDFKSNLIDQLEKYEGMRVTVAELTVVAPTNGRSDESKGTAESDGTFYGVVKGLARPFREAGFDIYDFLTMPDKEQERLKKATPKLALFDHNPERLRVESTAQLGAQPIDVTTFAEIKNLTGVVHYGYRAYSILVDADNKPAISNLVKAQPLPAPNERQFSIAATNLERFFDDEDDPSIREPIITTEGFERRLKKVSLAVRTYMQMPDVIGVIEIENLAVLKKLADRINKDAETSGKPNPKYEAYLVEGSDPGGIDSGFLVKRARVEVLETKQFGKEDKFTNPVSKNDVFLNDRPPFLLRAVIKDAKTNPEGFEFTVIVNHLKSFRGYTDEKDAPFVQMKKKLQAEFLAKAVAERLKANPNERIALVGDFNFYQFNDGIMDVIGTIKGTPAAKDAVMNVAEDLLNPDLTNLVDVIKQSQAYSYSFDGNAQAIDQFLVSDNFKNYVKGFGFAHINADFPEIYRNDPNRVERYSDHDAAVAFFTLDPK
jgi:predicted extracellular nuclease